MLVPIKKILLKAMKNKYAVGAFNVNNMEQAQAVAWAAEELNAPVIIQTTESSINYAGWILPQIIKIVAKNTRTPIAMHLDHGKNLDFIKKCLGYGYASVSFDGSSLPFKKNIDLTKKVVSIAHKKNIAVEAMLGDIDNNKLTDPRQAEEFVKKTDIDFLSVSIGNKHGLYREKVNLHYDLLKQIRRLTDIPLVLHGGSDTPEHDIKKCILSGISKINIDTDLRIGFTDKIREILKDEKIIDPRAYLSQARDEFKKITKEKIRLFSC